MSTRLVSTKKMDSTTDKDTSLLRQPFYFPLRLEDVDDINEPSMSRYKEVGWTMMPSLHWTFLFEVVEYQHVNISGRPEVLCRDVDGEMFKLIGYFEESINPRRNDEFDRCLSPHIKCGRTLALRYGEKKRFMDMTVGIRLEDSHVPFLEVIPGSIKELLATADAMFESEASATCWSCGQTFHSLKACARCKCAKYCGKECQTAHWKLVHKTHCKLMESILELTGRGRTPFDLAQHTGKWMQFRY